MRSYISFYTRIQPLGHHFVTALFDDLVADPALTIRRMNRRFGTAFASGAATADNRAEILEGLETMHERRGDPEAALAIPSREKDALKQELTSRLERHRLMPRARAVYARWATAGSGCC